MERWIKRNERKILFFGVLLIVLSVITLNLQFPKELRGGVMTRLDVLEINYDKRERSLREEMGALRNGCMAQREIIQTQFKSMWEMRNDVYPPNR